MTKIEQLRQEIEALPEEAQDFLLDFVELLKQRYPQAEKLTSTEVSQNSLEEKDPLIGLFSASPSLSTKQEDISQLKYDS